MGKLNARDVRPVRPPPGCGSTCAAKAPACSQIARPTVPGLSAIAIDGGSGHECALLPTGEVRCWGRNAEGQLGTGAVGVGLARALRTAGWTLTGAWNRTKARAVSASELIRSARR